MHHDLWPTRFAVKEENVNGMELRPGKGGGQDGQPEEVGAGDQCGTCCVTLGQARLG